MRLSLRREAHDGMTGASKDGRRTGPEGSRDWLLHCRGMVVQDQEGHEMLFALMADDIAQPQETKAQHALDAAAGALGACRCGQEANSSG